MKNKKGTEKISTEKVIKKMEKTLESMKKNKGISAEAIAGQKKALDEKKAQLNVLKEKEEAEQNGSYKDKFLTFSVVDGETLEKKEKQYKVAFVKHNRPINKNKVDGFIRIIANGKYEKNVPIFAITAAEAIESGYEVTDMKDNTITKEIADDYLVILDGQHRTLAFLKCNLTEKRVVPSTYLKTGINIGQYLVDINDVGTSWNQQDRFAVAALVSNDELAQNIADRINDGFNPTTASLIYTGKKITGKEVKKLLRGESWVLPDGANLDISRGNKFIQLCKEANISVKYITKRYFITGFNAYAKSEGEEKAFEQLKKLKEQNLTEQKLKKIKDGTEFEEMLRKAA